MKPGDGFSDDQVLELERLMASMHEAWPSMVLLLNNEAMVAMRAGLFDADRPREYYAGYVVALEAIAGLPQWVIQKAEEIRQQREADALANAGAVAKTLRRENPRPVTGGEVSGS